MSALSQVRSAGLSVSLAGDFLKVIPSDQITLPWRAFLKSNKAAIVSELKSLSTAGQKENDSTRWENPINPKIIGWLHAIGEDSQEIIDEVIDKCLSNPETLAYYLLRSEEVPEQMIQCQDCQHFKSFNPQGRGSGTCSDNVLPVVICQGVDTSHVYDQFQPLIAFSNRILTGVNN